ncbi:MAG: hypothetical protein WC071_03995 [Victivallaceae bacterium]
MASKTDATTPDYRPEERQGVQDGRDYTGLSSGRKTGRPRRTRLHRTVVRKKDKADATTPKNDKRLRIRFSS